MALGTCDACGEEPVAWMLSNTENGNTQGLGNFCLVTFAGQLAEQLGLMEASPDPDAGGAPDGSAGPEEPAKRGEGRGRRRAEEGTPDPSSAAADASEASEPAAADAG